MTSRPTTPRLPRLYLVTPPIQNATELPAGLGAALAAANVAAVLVQLATADERTLTNCIKTLAPAIQEAGAALLLDGHDEIVGRTGSDGAHLAGVEALKDAMAHLKPDRIAGASGLASRHDAMLAAEAGADYVMFGEPDAQGERPSFEAILDRVEWWSEVFQSPCVAYAASLEEVRPLSAAGADFIALAPFVFSDPRGVAATLADAVTRLGTEVPA
jgi:thiamine-phosphate pyrophosphorylase